MTGFDLLSCFKIAAAEHLVGLTAHRRRSEACIRFGATGRQCSRLDAALPASVRAMCSSCTTDNFPQCLRKMWVVAVTHAINGGGRCCRQDPERAADAGGRHQRSAGRRGHGGSRVLVRRPALPPHLEGAWPPRPPPFSCRPLALMDAGARIGLQLSLSILSIHLTSAGAH